MSVEANFALACYLYRAGHTPVGAVKREGRTRWLFRDDARKHVSSYKMAAALLADYERRARPAPRERATAAENTA